MVYLLAKYADLTVNGQSQAILGILVIGAGTDYALLLVARYREELRRHEDRHEAMAFALHRAAPAILASAATVVVGMLCLVVADLNSTAGMGPVLAVGIAITFLVMVTLLPALLVIFGRWMFWPKRPAFGCVEPNNSGLWAKVGAWIAPKPRKVWTITAGVLLVACLGLFTLSTDGPVDRGLVHEGVRLHQGPEGARRARPARQLQHRADRREHRRDRRRGRLARRRRRARRARPRPSRSRTPARTSRRPIDADISSSAAFDIVEDTRDAVHGVDGADAVVGGGSAFYLDTKIASNRDNKVIIPIVLIVVLLILIGLLRAHRRRR